jgi:hypothetical protein
MLAPHRRHLNKPPLSKYVEFLLCPNPVSNLLVWLFPLSRSSNRAGFVFCDKGRMRL